MKKELNLKIISAIKYENSNQVILNLKNEHEAELFMKLINRFKITLEPERNKK